MLASKCLVLLRIPVAAIGRLMEQSPHLARRYLLWCLLTLKKFREGNSLGLGEPSVHRNIILWLHHDDDAYSRIKDREIKTVAMLEFRIERGILVGVHRLHSASHFERAIRVCWVLDVKGDSTFGQQVAVFLPCTRVREANSRTVPGEPHGTTLRTAVRANSGEVGEERTFEEILVTRGKRCGHDEPFMVGELKKVEIRAVYDRKRRDPTWRSSPSENSHTEKKCRLLTLRWPARCWSRCCHCRERRYKTPPGSRSCANDFLPDWQVVKDQRAMEEHGRLSRRTHSAPDASPKNALHHIMW